MVYVSPEARQLIGRYGLGGLIETYKPHTILSIIGGMFFIAFALFWIVVAASITQSPLLPSSLLLFQFPFPSIVSSNSIFTVFGIVFPLFGLIFVVVGLLMVIRAILNRNIRAIVCTNGVVSIKRKSADAFRWEQVLQTFKKVSVSTTHYRSSTTGASAGSSTSIHYTYSVHCHDGRKFVFDSTLGRVQDLAETIEVEVARHRR